MADDDWHAIPNIFIILIVAYLVYVIAGLIGVAFVIAVMFGWFLIAKNHKIGTVVK